MPELESHSEENNLSIMANKPSGEVGHDCPVTTAIDVIGGKWKVIILYQLRGQTLRFGELKRCIPNITQKMLSQQLRELEKNKLITREVYAEVPPRVEYTPTALAQKLDSVLDALCAWGFEYEKAHGISTG